jgi:predicted metalloendopeptidase
MESNRTIIHTLNDFKGESTIYNDDDDDDEEESFQTAINDNENYYDNKNISIEKQKYFPLEVKKIEDNNTHNLSPIKNNHNFIYISDNNNNNNQTKTSNEHKSSEEIFKQNTDDITNLNFYNYRRNEKNDRGYKENNLQIIRLDDKSSNLKRKNYKYKNPYIGAGIEETKKENPISNKDNENNNNNDIIDIQTEDKENNNNQNSDSDLNSNNSSEYEMSNEEYYDKLIEKKKKEEEEDYEDIDEIEEEEDGEEDIEEDNYNKEKLEDKKEIDNILNTTVLNQNLYKKAKNKKALEICKKWTFRLCFVPIVAIIVIGLLYIFSGILLRSRWSMNSQSIGLINQCQFLNQENNLNLNSNINNKIDKLLKLKRDGNENKYLPKFNLTDYDINSSNLDERDALKEENIERSYNVKCFTNGLCYEDNIQNTCGNGYKKTYPLGIITSENKYPKCDIEDSSPSVSSLKMINDLIDPCDDFYLYSCGNWLNDKRNIEERDHSFESAEKRSEMDIERVIDITIASDLKLETNIGKLWKSCMNFEEPLLNLLNEEKQNYTNSNYNSNIQKKLIENTFINTQLGITFNPDELKKILELGGMKKIHQMGKNFERVMNLKNNQYYYDYDKIELKMTDNDKEIMKYYNQIKAHHLQNLIVLIYSLDKYEEIPFVFGKLLQFGINIPFYLDIEKNPKLVTNNKNVLYVEQSGTIGKNNPWIRNNRIQFFTDLYCESNFRKNSPVSSSSHLKGLDCVESVQKIHSELNSLQNNVININSFSDASQFNQDNNQYFQIISLLEFNNTILHDFDFIEMIERGFGSEFLDNLSKSGIWLFGKEFFQNFRLRNFTIKQWKDYLNFQLLFDLYHSLTSVTGFDIYSMHYVEEIHKTVNQRNNLQRKNSKMNSNKNVVIKNLKKPQIKMNYLNIFDQKETNVGLKLIELYDNKLLNNIHSDVSKVKHNGYRKYHSKNYNATKSIHKTKDFNDNRIISTGVKLNNNVNKLSYENNKIVINNEIEFSNQVEDSYLSNNLKTIYPFLRSRNNNIFTPRNRIYKNNNEEWNKKWRNLKKYQENEEIINSKDLSFLNNKGDYNKFIDNFEELISQKQSRMKLRKERSDIESDYNSNSNFELETTHTCHDMVKTLVPFLISDIFISIEKESKKEIIESIKPLLKRGKNKLIEKISNSEWLNSISKDNIITKLSQIDVYISDFWNENSELEQLFSEDNNNNDDDDLDFIKEIFLYSSKKDQKHLLMNTSKSFFKKTLSHSVKFNKGSTLIDNILVIRRYAMGKSLRRMLNQFQNDPPLDQLFSPIELANAYNSPFEKLIYIGTGLLTPPFYRPTYSITAILSQMMFIIYHEMAHSIDKNGIQFGNNDDQSSLLIDSSDITEFNNRINCFITSYIDKTPLGKHFTDPTLTLNENIADNIGFDLSLSVLTDVIEETFKNNKKNYNDDFKTSVINSMNSILGRSYLNYYKPINNGLIEEITIWEWFQKLYIKTPIDLNDENISNKYKIIKSIIQKEAYKELFIGYSQLFCQRIYSSSEEYERILKDEHSLGVQRVNLITMTRPEFKDIFSCGNNSNNKWSSKYCSLYN